MTRTRQEYWAKLIAEQETAGQTPRSFCRERGIGEHSFYMWRKRLRESQQPVRFALLETKLQTKPGEASGDSVLELVLRSGERLLIGNDVDRTTLQMVLEAVRG